ncbi:MAG: phospholipid carrier-dependent glycosyltransferase [bacterium]|nr:phospholipid carrier-dependent glycosyltransferase [bacterium]
MNNFLKKYGILILLVLGIATRFAWFWYPANVVWDEQHFCNFTKGYLEGKYFFDIHPPLGKFMLLAGLEAAGASTENLDCAIGTPYPDGYPYVAARVLPTLAGALLPLIVYFLGRALKLSRAAAFFAGILLLLDNAILAESRFALIDIFVPFFGFLALLAFLIHRKKEVYTWSWWLWLATSAISASLAIGTKWTGGGALLVMGIATMMEAVERKSFRLFLTRTSVILGITAVTYLGLYAVHFSLLPQSGTGDAFMTPAFRAALQGTQEQQNGEIAPPSFFGKTIELNKKMFVVNAAQKLTHQDSSRFYEWPIGRKQIYFWVSKADGMVRIYLRANPIVWLFGTILTLGSILYLVFRRNAIKQLSLQQADWKDRLRTLEFLFIIYLVNWLPFAAITRAMFLYHYFTSLIASLLIGAYLLFELVPALENVSNASKEESAERSSASAYLYWIIIALAVAACILFSPLTYGFRPFFS